MTEKPPVILASGSAIRADILRNAGVNFEVMRPAVDESVIKKEARAEGLSLDETAQRLADAKTLDIARKTSDIVIGSDQILEFKGRPFDKPQDMAEARKRLREMRGDSHRLINAVSVARRGEIIWRHLEKPILFMRNLTEEEINDYLSAAGPSILTSVGAYQIENLGSRLFDRIEGDYFAVLGLSLYPLLNCLRREGALDF